MDLKCRGMLASAACLLAAMASWHQPAAASDGFAVGREIQWTAPPPSGASEWRAGQYSGTIVETSGGGEKGSASRTQLIDLATGKSFWVPMDGLTDINCSHRRVTVEKLGKATEVCEFRGSVNGTYGLATLGWLRVALFDEVVLGDGTTARYFAGYYSSFGHLRLGRGPNQWAKQTGGGQRPDGGVQIKPQPPKQPDRPHPPVQGEQVVPEVGQAYAQALNVAYPAIIQGHMTQGDYDTFLFDFGGGPFHASARSTLDLVADLLDAQGKMIARARASNGTLRFDQSLPAGRYGIIVRVMYHAGGGDYELTIGSGGGARYRERL